MVLLIFVGLFVARAWKRGVGILIVGLAGAFLLGTQAKSPLQLLPIILLTIWLVGRVRHPAVVAGLLLAVPVGILALTVGSVLSDPIRTLLESTMSDPTFTGRDVIWIFAIEHTAQRPILGFGFQAFWGTSELVEAWNPQESWGYRSSDAHNSFLDLSVMTGLVGMVLASSWTVVQPIVDYLRSRLQPVDPALTTLFMQIWFFGLCESAFESIYFSGGSAIWFMVVVAMIGLRFQNAFHLCR
jgi:O-antigen ligase